MASYLDRLIKRQEESYGEGTTMDPITGGFLLPTGEFLNLGAYGTRADDHRVVGHVLPPSVHKKYYAKQGGSADMMVLVCKKVGMYRWMPENWSMEAWTPPTREQGRAINQLHEHKPITIEAWKGGRSWTREFEPWDDPADHLSGFFRYGVRYFMRGDEDYY